MKNDEILIILVPGNDTEQYLLKVDSRISYSQLLEGINQRLKTNIEDWILTNTIPCGDISDKANRSLRELGFVTGTVISYLPQGNQNEYIFNEQVLQSQLFSKRHKNEDESEKQSMKYNITNRFIAEMEETVIDVISPGNPPRPGNNSIFDMIIPTLISFGTMYGFRALFITEANNGMMLFMGCSVLGTFLVQAYRYQRNKKNFKKSKALWKANYEAYLNRLCQRIEDYQAQDILYLKESFPSMKKLFSYIEGISGMVFFSRSINDFDFMKITLGSSPNVSSLFTIHHDVKEEIELGITFYDDNGQIKVNLIDEKKGFWDKFLFSLKTRFLKLSKKPVPEHESEDAEKIQYKYLNELSEYLASERYRYLSKITSDAKREYPPLVLDFKNCGALGCIGFEDETSRNMLLNHILY